MKRIPANSLVIAIALSAVCFAAFELYHEWQRERPFRDRAKSQREQEQAIAELWDSCDRLEKHGARIPRHKMLEGSPFQYVDLHQWHGDEYALRDLGALSQLPLVRSYDSDLHIRLGPSIDDAIVPILTCLGNIASLDVHGADISDEQIASIVNANPGCRLAEITFPP